MSMTGSRRRGRGAVSRLPRVIPDLVITGQPVSRRREALRADGRSVRRLVIREEGNAIVEFIGWSAVLVVPVLYLVVTLAQIQATTFAVAHGCARGQPATVKVSAGVDLPGFASLGIGRDVVVVDTERSITLPGKEEQ